MRYGNNIIPHRLLRLFLLGMVMLLLLPCGAQNPEYNNCTNNPGVHPLFTSWSLPDTVCAGMAIPFSIGYNNSNTIVLSPSESSEPTITKPERMFLPDPGDVPCNDNCVYRSSITVQGYNGTIQDQNSIKYVRLNLEHSYSGDLNIKLSCPDGLHSADILYYSNNAPSSPCGSSISLTSCGWQTYGNPFYAFGVGFTNTGDAGFPCDSLYNPPRTGANYCWSSNDTVGTYATSEGGYVYSMDMGTWSFNTTDWTNYTATDTSTLFPLYHPDESFGNFTGCSINGEWTIEIIDGGSNNSYNGYLFDWEIVFDESLAGGGGGGSGTVDSAVVLNEGVKDDQLFEQDASDTVFTFTAPTNITENTTIERTLRLFNPEAGCYYDTVFSIVVTPPATTVHYDTICEGESITLNATYNPTENILFNEGFSSITQGNDHGSGGSNNAYDNPPSFHPLSNFPYSSNVYRAGGHLRIGNTTNGGYITSTNLDLSSPYSIKLWLRGWNHASEHPHFYLKVDGSTVSDQNIPISAWNGSYKEYSYNSTTAANANSTITIGNTAAHQRFFIDSVVVLRQVTCQYAWNTGASSESITVSPSPSGSFTYYVLITPSEGCARVDTFHVIVRPRPTVTFDPCGGTCSTTSMQMNCQEGINLPAATPCATDYVFAGWSTSAVTPAVSTEPTPLYIEDEHYLSTTDITLYAVYKKCTNPNECTEWEYWSYPVYPSASTTASTCESYTWHRTGASDTTIYESGTYLHRHTNANGCVYVDTLRVTINPILHGYYETTICDNQLPYVFHGETFTEAGTVNVTHYGATAQGCDSTLTLTVNVNPVLHGDYETTICDNQLPFTFHGEVFDAAGTINVTHYGATAQGCDSTLTLTVNVNPVLHGDYETTICDNQLP